MRHFSAKHMLPLLLVGALPARALAEEEKPDVPRLGLSPGEPQVRSAPPAIPYGTPADSKESVLDFHGYMLLPLRISVLKRPDPQEGQSGTSLHSPPVIPQERQRFEFTGAIPQPWIQFNLAYGNRTVSATAIAVAESATDASGFFVPVDQLGINDAFITINLSDTVHSPFELKLGAFTGRYGFMGMYDAGRYATPLIARTNSIGETITASFDFGDTVLTLEEGLGGQLGRPERGAAPSAWNDFGWLGAAGTPSEDAPAGVGSSLVSHIHAGFTFHQLVQIAGHYITAWSQDDRAAVEAIPDGRINVLGAEMRLMGGRFGHFYLGGARTQAVNAAIVSGVVEILNARGGPELIEQYLGPESGGDGALNTFGAQYDLSVSRLLYGDRFTGRSPDLRLSLFGVGTAVQSDDPDFDGVTKLKAGTEITYTPLSWFGVSGRFDHVRPDSGDDRLAMTILSPRLLFHTDWLSRDELVLQYSRFIYGGDVFVYAGFPPVPDRSIYPDEHVFSLSGSFWW